MKASYRLATFGGNRHSGRGDIIVFVCHMTYKDHVIKMYNDYVVRSPSRYVRIIPSLLTIRAVTKAPRDIMGRSPPNLVNMP